MKQAIKIILLISFLINGWKGFSQNLSNRGKEFWAGYGHHQFMEPGQDNSQEMILYFSAEEAANVKVTIKGRTTTTILNYAVPANSVIASGYMPKSGPEDCRLYDLPPSFGGNGGEGLFDLSIHIESDVPIVAYAHTFGSASSGATMLMPVETWGYSYTSVNSKQSYASNCFSWMYVVAEKDNTVVEITPSVSTRNGRVPGVPFTITLNRGQIYQVVGALISGSDGYELTGTKVKSIANAAGECYPIGAFSGSSRTSNPISCGSGGGDNDNQQLFPSQAWGKRYLTAPTSTSNGANQFMTNSYKVLIKDPTTIVKRNGTPLTGLLVNSYYFFESSTADLIEADKPIMVAQFMTGGSCMSGGLGDPEMMYISPVEQGIKRVGFYRNNRESIAINYLTLIIPTAGVSSLRIDGSATVDHSYAHPRLPGYTVVVKRWTAAQSQCIVQSDSAFTAITYGLGSVESYGYNAGTLINNLSAISYIHNELDSTQPEHPFTCTQTPVEISALFAYQPTRLEWEMSQLAAVATPSADVIDNAPVSSGTVIVKGVQYYKYRLPGSYQFSNAGTYNVPIRSSHPSIENCNNREDVKIQVVVKEKPKADFTFTSPTACSLDTVHLNAVSATTDGYTLANWKWTFPGGTTAKGQDTVHLFAPGVDQDIALSVVTGEGCVSDTTRKITIYSPPTGDFTISPAVLCEGDAVTFTPTASYGGTSPVSSWNWDFGSGSLNSPNGDPQSITYNTNGSHTVKYAVGVSARCIGDTVSHIITTYARPVVDISYPGGCLPANGIVQFTNNTSAPDGQTINTHTWNFGDANATPGNPNTSGAINPSHNYSIYGDYDITYSAISAQGCTTDTIIKATFNPAPQLSYSSLPSVCINNAPVSVATASVTNGAMGTGIYGGPGTTTAGMFDPAVAGAGIHTITYTFTTNSGCIQPVSSTIEVYAKPVSSFTAGNSICLNEVLTLSNASTISGGTIQAWNWELGNGDNPSFANGNPFTVSYTTFNDYTVKLVTVSDHGCISDPFTQTIAVHPLPVADFNPPTGICMPGGSAVFTNASSVPDNSSLSYTWKFGDPLNGTSTSANPSYVYGSKGSYNVTVTAVSAFGCTATSNSKLVNSFYDKPVASFTVSPVEICQGADNVFANHSTAPGSTISASDWSFGDGTASPVVDPVKQFNRPGVYMVALKVTNAGGCVSDAFTVPVTVHLQPVIDAGSSFVVPQGTTIVFNATANDNNLDFNWTPATMLSNATLLRPSMIANSDQDYTLTATGDFGCTATDKLTVKILKPVKIPNAFSPNRDNVHDTWLIPNLVDYPGCTVEIFNRYGQEVFYSVGYSTPWDGKVKGKDMPVGTYYYVIKLQNGFAPRTGSVTLLK